MTKCVVKDCKNDAETSLCGPCQEYVSTGAPNDSRAYLNSMGTRPNKIHTPAARQRIVELCYEDAIGRARLYGVGMIVIIVDASEGVQYMSGLGPTMTAGALARSQGLYDSKGRPPELDPDYRPRGVAHAT